MKRNETESEEFRKYREQMHGSETEDASNPYAPGRIMRVVFSVFMIIVYLGMGVALLLPANIFGFPPSIDWIRYAMGSIFIIYGIWRAYRAYMGIDSRF